MDFTEARERRRLILKLLREQQAEDASCANEIKNVAIQGKIAILRSLADWVTSITPGRPVTPDVRRIFAMITEGLTLDDWVQAQAEYEDAERKLNESIEAERNANANYTAAAPWGGISSLFADEARRKRIGPLKVSRDAARRTRENAQVTFEAARQRLSDQCNRVLRDGSTPERLQRVCSEPEMRARIAPIADQTNSIASDLWTAHARRHSETSARMEAAIRELREYYCGPSGTAMAVLANERSR